MTQPYPYIALTTSSGTDTIVLSSGTNTPGDYTIVRRAWAPKVATLRESLVGGQGSYNDVIEEMEINVRGATANDLYMNVNRLISMLERAKRFVEQNGVGGEAIQLRYAAQGSAITSTGAPLHALVLGPPPGESGLELPPNWLDSGVTSTALRCRLRFVRRGRLVLPYTVAPVPEAEIYQISQFAANGRVHRVVFPSPQTVFVPIKIGIEGRTSITQTIIPGGYFCYSSFYQLYVLPAAISSNHPSQFTLVPENFTLTGVILRYTPTNTNLVYSAIMTHGNEPPIQSRIPYAVLVAVRTNNPNRQFWLRIQVIDSTGQRYYQTHLVAIPRGLSTPQIIRAGILMVSDTLDAPNPRISIGCQVNDASGSPSLDINYVALIPIVNRSARVIQHEDVLVQTIQSPSPFYIVAENADWRNVSPRFGVGTTFSPTYSMTYYDAIDVEGWFPQQNTSVYATWLATSGPYWHYVIDNSVVQTRLVMYRSFGFLGPQ